jgi:hypothetical protein
MKALMGMMKIRTVLIVILMSLAVPFTAQASTSEPVQHGCSFYWPKAGVVRIVINASTGACYVEPVRALVEPNTYPLGHAKHCRHDYVKDVLQHPNGRYALCVRERTQPVESGPLTRRKEKRSGV